MKCVAVFLLSIAIASPHAKSQTANSAIFLNGIDAYGTAGGVGALVSDSTYEAWFWVPPGTTISSAWIVERWGMWSNGLHIDEAAGQAQVDTYSCGPFVPCPEVASPRGTFTQGQWHHAAIVFGAGNYPTVNVYIDGTLAAWCGGGPCVPSDGWTTVLGASGYIGITGFFHGAIDELRISNVQRYAGQFIPATTFTPDANAVGLWHFDEGAGNVAHDASGHGLDFTLQGGFSWVAGNAFTLPSFTLFGHGCPGSAGEARLEAAPGQLPYVGRTLNMLISAPSAPTTLLFPYVGLDRNQWLGWQLPGDLGPLGMPGCLLYADMFATFGLTSLTQPAIWTIDIPNMPALIGMTAYLQCIVVDPTANATGTIVTNAAACTIG